MMRVVIARPNVRVERRAHRSSLRSHGRFHASAPMMGWTPPVLCAASSCQAESWVWRQHNERKESDMHPTTVAIDLAKNVFQLAIADCDHRVLEQHRLTRSQFMRFFENRNVQRIVMEACGSAHHWARTFSARGIEVILLPPQYVRAYVRRNKTDAADAKALLEAARDCDLRPVKIKSVEQQALQALHRTRSLWMATRTARINAVQHGPSIVTVPLTAARTHRSSTFGISA